MFHAAEPSIVKQKARGSPVSQEISFELIDRARLAPPDHEVSMTDARTGSFPAAAATAKTEEQASEY
jgi:hypothetical protein